MEGWRERYARKLITAEEAAGLVQDGMTLHFGMFAADPWFLMSVLAERREALRDVVAYGDLARVAAQWDERLGEERHIELRAGYLTPGPRSAYRAGPA
jgi:acyl-CoA hydrolase